MRSAWLRLLSGLAATAALCGCGGYDVTPPAAVARTALERSLMTWKDGGSPGPIAGAEPPVQAIDSEWQNGRKLASFEILGEEGGAGDRRFTVRLVGRDPAGEKEARYVVLGQGPVLVYREEDYRKMLDMDNNPAPPKTKRGR